MDEQENEEELAINEWLFYYYNVEGNTNLTSSDDIYCSDYLYCE